MEGVVPGIGVVVPYRAFLGALGGKDGTDVLDVEDITYQPYSPLETP